MKKDDSFEGSSKDILLYHIINGSAMIETFEKNKVIKKDHIIVFNPLESHKVQILDGICAILSLSNTRVLRLMDNQRKTIICDVEKDMNETASTLKKNIHLLLRSFYEHGERQNIMSEQYSLQLVYYLISNYSNNVFSEHEDKRKKDITDYLEAHYSEDLSLEEIADEFSLTVPYFSKYFKETFGKTFLSYLNQIRIEYASDDLIRTKENALRIAVNNGFPNAASFIREFRKHYGMTPTEYREAYRITEMTDEASVVLPYLEEVANEESHNIVKVEIDAAEKGSPLQRYWTKVLNLHSFKTVMKSSMTDQIIKLQDELNFRYVRLKLDTYSADGRHMYYVSDKVMELFVRLHLDVIVVIDLRDVDDEDRFLDFVREQTKKFVKRFGDGIRRHMAFELMYNSDYTSAKLKGYERFYGKLSRIVSGSEIDSPVLGPSVLIDHDGNNFRLFVKAVPSLKTYTITVAPFAFYHKDGEVFINRLTDSAYVKQQYQMAKGILEEEGIEADVLISSWQDSLNEIDALNETSYMGARIIKNVLSGYDILTSLPLNTPLDLIYDEMTYDKVFNLLPGIMTNTGIVKPSYHALRFLNQQDKNLVKINEDTLITRSDDEGFYQILCHNCKKLGYDYYTKESLIALNDKDELFEDEEEKAFEFVFEHMPKGKYLIKIRSVNDESGCAYTAYQRLNYQDDTFIGMSETNYLKAASVVKMHGENHEVKEDGVLKISCTLQANEFMHLHIIRVVE